MSGRLLDIDRLQTEVSQLSPQAKGVIALASAALGFTAYRSCTAAAAAAANASMGTSATSANPSPAAAHPLRQLIKENGGAGAGASWEACWENELVPWDLDGPTAALVDLIERGCADRPCLRTWERMGLPIAHTASPAEHTGRSRGIGTCMRQHPQHTHGTHAGSTCVARSANAGTLVAGRSRMEPRWFQGAGPRMTWRRWPTRRG